MNYFLFLNGQQTGPYTEDQLRQFLAAGQIQATDFAWYEGLADWAPIASLLPAETAAPVAAPAPQPAPAPAAIPEGKLRKEPVVPKQVVRQEEPEEPASRIKTWMWIVGGVAAAGILCVVAAIAYLFWEGGQMDASSKAYVDKYVSSIAPAWSADDFINHVAPQYREQFDHGKVDALFSKLSALGSLKQYNGSMGESHISIRSLGKSVSARYSARATFDEGDGTFEFVLLRVDGQWTMAGLSIKSPVLQR
jgi:GYF domain 2